MKALNHRTVPLPRQFAENKGLCCLPRAVSFQCKLGKKVPFGVSWQLKENVGNVFRSFTKTMKLFSLLLKHLFQGHFNKLTRATSEYVFFYTLKKKAKTTVALLCFIQLKTWCKAGLSGYWAVLRCRNTAAEELIVANYLPQLAFLLTIFNSGFPDG